MALLRGPRSLHRYPVGVRAKARTLQVTHDATAGPPGRYHKKRALVAAVPSRGLTVLVFQSAPAAASPVPVPGPAADAGTYADASVDAEGDAKGAATVTILDGKTPAHSSFPAALRQLVLRRVGKAAARGGDAEVEKALAPLKVLVGSERQ